VNQMSRSMPDIFELIKALKEQAVLHSNDVQKQCNILHRGVEKLIILTVREEQAAVDSMNQPASQSDIESINGGSQSRCSLRNHDNPWTCRRQSLIRALAQSSVVGLSYPARRDILTSALHSIAKSGSCYKGTLGPANLPERAHGSGVAPVHFPPDFPSSHRKESVCITLSDKQKVLPSKTQKLILDLLGRIADRPSYRQSSARAPHSQMRRDEPLPLPILAAALAALDLRPSQRVLNAWCERDLAAVAVAHIVATPAHGAAPDGGAMHCATDDEEQIERLRAILEAQVRRAPPRPSRFATRPCGTTAPHPPPPPGGQSTSFSSTSPIRNDCTP
jgi:hypothetical protein